MKQQERLAAERAAHSSSAFTSRSCMCARSGSPCNLQDQDIFTTDVVLIYVTASDPMFDIKNESDSTVNTVSLSF